MKSTVRAPLVAWMAAAMIPAAMGCEGETVPVVPSGPPPEAVKAPPPISGGTLAVTRDGRFAIAADAASDRVFVVDLESGALAHDVELEPGDEPGRVLEGAGGRIHVALRRGGAVATFDVAAGEIVARRSACPAPRGMAYDAGRGLLHVACAGGEVVGFADDQTAPVRMVRVARDLRDVVLSGDKLMVSRFRSAEVLLIDADGQVEQVMKPHDYTSPRMARPFAPAVAWRMQALPGGGAAVVHQRGFAEEIPTGAPPVTGQSYYGGFCDQVIVHAAVTVFHPDAGPVTQVSAGGIGNLVLPVDLAVSPDGQRMAVVAAGNEQVFETTLDAALSSDVLVACSPFEDQTQQLVFGEPLAVAYRQDGALLVQTRQPAGLHVLAGGQAVSKVEFPGPSRRDWGHSLFHRAAADSSPIACASCHPEGGDDGRVWHFDVGPRRTQNLSGGIMSTLPLHWDGDLDTMHDFMGEVFVNRMGGLAQPADRVEALAAWVDQLPVVSPSSWRGAEAAERGEALFNDAEVGCASCHVAGRTNNTTVDVGTGKAFQVPSLVGVAHRAPFMHDGCAATLHDRFDPSCGGGDAHGHTSHLTPEQIDDLVAYLETL